MPNCKMTLSDDQIALIKEKAANGAQLNDLQKFIQNDFQTNITYMETRFLISDLGIEILTEEEPVEEEETKEDILPESELPPNEGGVSVTVDQVTRPGVMVSGSVTWSDRKSSTWYVDQMGQLGLESAEEGYQPSPEDVEAFQIQLRQALGQ